MNPSLTGCKISHSFWKVSLFALLLILSGSGASTPAQFGDDLPPDTRRPRRAERLAVKARSPLNPRLHKQHAEDTPDKVAIENFIKAGNEARVRENYDEAERQYKNALARNPNEPRAYLGLGNLYLDQLARTNQFDKTIRAYQKAIEFNPQYAEAYYGLGTVYYIRQNYRDAIQQYETAISKNPAYADAYNSLGGLYTDLYRISGSRSLQDAQKAVENYRKALDSEPSYYAANFNLGDLYYDMKLYSQAVEQYKQVITIKADHANAYYNLGMTYLKLNNKIEAGKQNLALQNLCPSLADRELRTSCSSLASQLSDAINRQPG